MAWIETEREDEWTGELGEQYNHVVDRTHGRVDNIMQIHALDPAGMKAHVAVYKSTMASTKTLRRVEREIVAVVVSTINDCHY